jgi:hypothetical protein
LKVFSDYEIVTPTRTIKFDKGKELVID